MAAAYSAGQAEAAGIRAAAAEAAARKEADEALEWRRQAERAMLEAATARECLPSSPPLQPAPSKPPSPSPDAKRALAAETVAAEATTRADVWQAEGAQVAERLQEQLGALVLALEGLQPEAALSATAESECRRAVASAEGRLQLEQQRYTQQIERLEFENEELRRATRAKSDKISALKQQLTERTSTGR